MTRILVYLGLLLVFLSTAAAWTLDKESQPLVLAPVAVSESPESSPEDTSAPGPEPLEAPAPPPNRFDCRTIRGTEYLSLEERQWFMENCAQN